MFFHSPPPTSTLKFFTKQPSPRRLDECISSGSTCFYEARANSPRLSELVEAMKLWLWFMLKALDVQAHLVADIHMLHHHMPLSCQVKVERVGQAPHRSYGLWEPAGCRDTTDRNIPHPVCNRFPYYSMFHSHTAVPLQMHASDADITLSNGPGLGVRGSAVRCFRAVRWRPNWLPRLSLHYI